MVLDPLTGLGLAANVIQLVSFTSKLISKTCELYSAKPEGTVKERELLLGYQRLEDLCNGLVKPLNEHAKSRNLSPSETSLLEVSNECMNIAVEFKNKFQGIVSADKKSVLESFLQAVKSTWNQDELEKMDLRLQQKMNLLLTHLFAVLNSQENLNIKSLETKMDHIMLTIVSEFENFRTQSGREGVHDGRDQEWKEWCAEHHEEFFQVTTNISSAIDAKERREITEKILKTLFFGQIDDRRLEIREAHKRTFDWIFDTSMPNDHSNFINWLENNNNMEALYWVAGKPGSGKSTLMRFLSESPKTKDALRTWSGSRTLLSASAFFWSSGTEMQKSLQGLLRSLLYQLLKTQSALLPDVARERWRIYELGGSPPEWTNAKLVEVFDRLVEFTTKTHGIALLIDGLDEYQSDFDGQRELVKILKSHVGKSHVKICVSSRPLPVFKSAFERFPSLKLEDLTRSDIERFVQDELGKNAEFSLYEHRDGDECKRLMKEIVDKAQGVFLWVYLVVRDLMKHLIDGDDMQQLMNHLRNIPPDLNKYFKLILDGVHEEDKGRAGLYLKVKLASEHRLSLLNLSLVEKFQDGVDLLKFLKDGPPEDPRLSKDSEGLAARRLQGRCKGLLEAHRDQEQNGGSGELYVDYLHRTVRDFLQQEDTQTTLNKYIPGDFDCHAFLCQAVLVRLKMDLKSRELDCSLMEKEFFWYALETEIVSSLTSLHKSEIVDLAFCILATHSSISKPVIEKRIATALRYGLEDYPLQMLPLDKFGFRFADRMFGFQIADRTPLLGWATLSIPGQHGRMSKVIRRINRDLSKIHPQSDDKRRMFPSNAVVETLLQRGDGPNETIFPRKTVWEAFLDIASNFVSREDSALLKHLAQIARLFVKHGAKSGHPRMHMYSTYYDDQFAEKAARIFQDYGGDEMATLLWKNNTTPQRLVNSSKSTSKFITRYGGILSPEQRSKYADWESEQSEIYNNNRRFL